MPRAIWSGAITFGLVNVPVRLYSAVSEHKLHFNFIHEKDESPIGYQKICKLEEKPVPDKEIVKAFEYRKGKYVYMTDEDFAAARVEGYKAIDITDFVPYDQIDPIFFANTYLSGRRREPRRFTRSSSARWRTPSSPESRSSSCATASTSARCGCARE